MGKMFAIYQSENTLLFHAAAFSNIISSPILTKIMSFLCLFIFINSCLSVSPYITAKHTAQQICDMRHITICKKITAFHIEKGRDFMFTSLFPGHMLGIFFPNTADPGLALIQEDLLAVFVIKIYSLSALNYYWRVFFIIFHLRTRMPYVFQITFCIVHRIFLSLDINFLFKKIFKQIF